MARCGRTNLAGGGGVGSDETTATKDTVLKDYTYLGADTDDEIGTGTIESMEGTTVIPSASQQTVSTSGKYLTGDVIVSAVANLTAANIANGKVVGGTTGTYKGLGNATAAQVLAGKTFSTASLSNTAGTMINYSGYTSTSNYTSGTFKSGTTGYIFVVPGGTGYYSNATYLRIPATNLAAANIKKGVKILGITGTWDGFVATTTDIYNRGAFGSGYSKSLFVNYSDAYDPFTVTAETTALYIYSDCSDQRSLNVRVKLNKLINFTAYSKINFIVSGTKGFTWGANGSGSSSNSLSAYVNNTGGTVLSKTIYTDGGYSPSKEITSSIDVSSINQECYFSITLAYMMEGTGGATLANSHGILNAYIHRIWLS